MIQTIAPDASLQQDHPTHLIEPVCDDDIILQLKVEHICPVESSIDNKQPERVKRIDVTLSELRDHPCHP